MVIGIIILVGILFALIRIAKRKYEINKEISDLENQIFMLSEENRQLDRLLQYYNTEYYREKMAREELGLQKEGEEVLAIPGDIDRVEHFGVEKKDSDLENKTENLFTKSNIYKWWKYFSGS